MSLKEFPLLGRNVAFSLAFSLKKGEGWKKGRRSLADEEIVASSSKDCGLLFVTGFGIMGTHGERGADPLRSPLRSVPFSSEFKDRRLKI